MATDLRPRGTGPNLRSVLIGNESRHLSRLSEKRIWESGQGDTRRPDTNFLSDLLGSFNIGLVEDG